VKINHRIALNHDNPFWLGIERLGLKYERGDSNNVLKLAMPSVLNITENEPEWPDVARLVGECSPATHFVSNVFTKRELDAAEWLLLEALGHHGYPEPDIDYHTATDDIADYCPVCGIGGVQNAPFRLSAEPKASHSQFIQLNWVFDEFFLREEAREGLLEEGIAGIDFLAPVLHRTDRPSTQITQLRVRTVLPPALETESLETVTCKEENEEWETELRLRKIRPPAAASNRYCGRVKYHREHRGMFRFDRGAFLEVPDVVKSYEWFGSGASAHQIVIVSQRFRQAVVTAKWRGVTFEPIELA
jgi:hypothetical protein